MRCHPTNNVPFICPGASLEADGVSGAAGDCGQQEAAGANGDESKELAPLTEDESENGDADADEEDVPKVRSRP